MQKNFQSRRKKGLTFFLVGLMVFLLFIQTTDNRNLVQENLLREVETDISTLIDSTISSDQYRKIRDSLEGIKSWKKWRLIAPGGGFNSTFIGLRDVSECDSCGEAGSAKKNKDQFHSKYFLDLVGFTLKSDASFLIEKDKYFIKYYVADRVYENGSSGHYEIKQIPVRFASRFEQNKMQQTSLLIPLSKTAHDILNVLLWIFLTLLLLISLWSFIRFVSTLLSIANGKAFTLQNVRNLKFIAWFTIITTFLPILFALICQLVMLNRIPREIYFPYWLYILDNKGWLIASLIALLLADAFKSGYKLQQEQDLTI